MDMTNGNIDSSSAGTLALMYDTLRAGRGYGGGYGEGGGYGFWGGHGTYAGPGSNAVRIDSVSQKVEDQADATRELLGAQVDAAAASFENLTRANEFAATNKNIADTSSRICDRLSEQALREAIDNGNARLDNQRQLSDMRAESAKCCCDTQRLVIEKACETERLVLAENQKTRDLINENALRAAVDQNNINATVGAINQAAAANTAAIVAAIGQIGHHSHPHC
jgi:hypothetical protein